MASGQWVGGSVVGESVVGGFNKTYHRYIEKLKKIFCISKID